MRRRTARLKFPMTCKFILPCFVAILGGVKTQTQIVEVDTWTDELSFSDANSSTASEYCGSAAPAAGKCSLRAALFHASSLETDDVTIAVNAEETVVLTLGGAIPVTGPSTLLLNGNGHTVVDNAGNSFFRVNGSVNATFFNATFDGFHGNAFAAEVPNGVVISADDPDSSVFINQCLFQGSYVNTTSGSTGMGGVVYATGSLSIANSRFESNKFWSTASSSETSYSMSYSYTPSPSYKSAPATLTPSVSPFTVAPATAPSPDATLSPTPAPTESPTANFSTPAPSIFNSTTSVTDLSTPSPTTPLNETIASNSTANVTDFSTPSPSTSLNETTISNSTANGTDFSTPSPSTSLNETTISNSTANGTDFSTPSPSTYLNETTVSNSTANVTDLSTPSPSMSLNETIINNGTVNATGDAVASAVMVSAPSPVGVASASSQEPAQASRSLDAPSSPWPTPSSLQQGDNYQDDNLGFHGNQYDWGTGTSYPPRPLGRRLDDLDRGRTDPLTVDPGSNDARRQLESSPDTASETYLSDEDVRVGGAVFWDNRAMIPGKTLTISGCYFADNSVTEEDEDSWGGAVVAVGGLVATTSSVFTGNSASFGGGMVIQESTLTVVDCEFTGNVANQFGGGLVQLGSGSMDVQSTTFSYNTAGDGGGAVAVASVAKVDRYNMTDCNFFGNTAGGEGGGAVFMLVDTDIVGADTEGGKMTLTSPEFESNTALQYGSNINIKCGRVVIESSFADVWEEDEEGFTITPSYTDCSSLSFLEVPTSTGTPPALLSARFSDLGTALVVTFDMDTDYGATANLGGSFECILLLDYPGVNELDLCAWTSAATVTATLHYNASVAPEDILTILTDVVAASGTSDPLNEESVVSVSPPDDPPVPVLVPEVWYTALAHCQDLVVDVSSSTGAGGRVMSSYEWDMYNWTVATALDAPGAELEYLDQASGLDGSSSLTLPAENRSSQEELRWFFNVSATNWLRGIGWNTFEVLVSAKTEDPPLLYLVGGSSRTVLRASNLGIVSIAEAISCPDVSVNKTGYLEYVWSELLTGETFVSTSADPSIFKLPSQSLEVGVTYEFQVEVTDSLGFTSLASQIITVESSALIASVAGGNSTVSSASDVALDLAATVDPDEEDAVCTDCVYLVSCVGTLSGDACSLTLPEGEFTDGALTIALEELVSEETYILEVSVRRSSESTWSVTSTYFEVAGDVAIPLLSITPLTVEKVNADDTVAILAEVTSSLQEGATAVWTLTEGVLDGYDDLSLAAASSLEYTISGMGGMSANMVLSPNTLVVGSSYTFSLSATYSSSSIDGRQLSSSSSESSSGSSSSSVTILVNTPPTGGTFTVLPTQGSAFETEFLFRTFAWEDDVDDLPILYAFSYVSGSTNESDIDGEVIVRATLESSEASDIFLPQGYGLNSTLVASVSAEDSLGASARETSEVYVMPYVGSVEDLGFKVDELATEAFDSGDSDTVMQILDVASSTLNAANCTAAPDCEALNRDDCGTNGLREENTCGECTDGSVGVLGADNTICLDTTSLADSCFNGAHDGDETDVDCGGGSCTPCLSELSCLVDSDCRYNSCSDTVCVTPAKACPNNCGGETRGSCEYFASASGASLNSTECLADDPIATCRASCACVDRYGGDGCQYTEDELAATVALRQASLEFILASASTLDVTQDTITRQASLLAKLSVVPEEMQASSVALTLSLAVDTAMLADESGEGVSSTASASLVEIVGQTTATSAYLEEESNVAALSGVVGSLISAQVAGIVVGQNHEEFSSDYFRLSTGVYNAAALGGVQIAPPTTADDEAVGRSAPFIGVPEEVGDSLTGVDSLVLAVAEWIIDPRQTNATAAVNDTVVSTVVRLYADPVESTSRRRLQTRRGQRRSLLEEMGSLEISMPNSVTTEWDPQEALVFTHTCEWDSTETLSDTCPNGTAISTVCTGIATVHEVTCAMEGSEPECATWQALESASATVDNCEVTFFNESWTTCLCDYAATMGDTTATNQVDFASTFLNTPAEFISIWSEAETLTWSEVKSAAPVFATMASILALAMFCAGLGWRMDRKDQGLPAGFKAWCSSTVCFVLCCCCRSKGPVDILAPPQNSSATDISGKTAGNQGFTHDDNLKALAASATGSRTDDVNTTAPHHFGERRVKQSMKLLLMVHHDFLSVFYVYYQWFTRPQRLALLLCSVVTLMTADATVYATIMFNDDGTCGTLTNEADCIGSATANFNVGDTGSSSCGWDEGSRTCFLPEPDEDDLETSLIVSTIALIVSLPFELVLLAVFAAVIVRPTVRSWNAATKHERAAANEQVSGARSRDQNRLGTVRDVSPEWKGESGKQGTLDGFQTRLAEELALARAAQCEEEGKLTRCWRDICCGCGLCGGEATRDARLVKRVTKSVTPAIKLEEHMAKLTDIQAQEAKLFEVAEADSLNHLERQVFQKTRILNFGEEDDISPVSTCAKYTAWLFVVVYATGMSFYVCLFAVKAGEAMATQWMISFWLAFLEDIVILIPLKLALVYLFVPSLMRHRMRPDMFTRIPSHAPSVQIARRRPDLQVSALILQGSIPVGSEFEKFIPLFHPETRWLACVTGVVFTTLAAILALPNTLQAMVVDTLLAVVLGGGLIGIGKILPVSLWGFVGLFVGVVILIFTCRHSHRRIIKAEKNIRKSRRGDALGYSIASNTGFQGYNINRANSSVATSPNHGTPSPKASNLKVPGSAHLAASSAAWTNRKRDHNEGVSPGGGHNLTDDGALGLWITAVRPGTNLPTSPAHPPPPPPHIVRGHSRNDSFGGDSDSASRWHGRDDSCAASCWQGINVSDNESSSNQDDGSAATRDWGRTGASSRHHVSHSEWGGLDATYDSRIRSSILGSTIASSFFDSPDSPSHRARDSLASFGDEDCRETPPSPERMTRVGSVWNRSRSQYEESQHGGGDESDEEDNSGAAMSRWDGSPAPSPAGSSPHARSRHF